MLRNTLGIVNIEGNNVQFGNFMNHRAIQAFSFLGRYRLIDFVLSNMSNSGITEYQVYMPKKMRATIQHVGTGAQYNINSKRGKLRLLTEEGNHSSLYNHDICMFSDNINYIKQSNKEYVLIAPSYLIYSQDYNKLYEQHLATNADITILYKNINDAKAHFVGSDTLKFDQNKRIDMIETNQGKYKNRAVSMETYFMKRSLFLELIKRANKTSSLYWLKDIIREVVNEYKIVGYAYKDYVACINTISSYFNTQLDLIDPTKRKLLFKQNWPIYTHTNDSSPTLYGRDADVTGSLVANGCKINGQVINSVIDRGVVIEEGATVKNSIICMDVHICQGTHIENAIIDKDTLFKHGVDIIGTPEEPVYTKRGEII